MAVSYPTHPARGTHEVRFLTRPPLTAFLWVLIGFLGVDAVLRVTVMILELGNVSGDTTLWARRSFEAILFATLDILLILQLLLRTFAARVFGSLLFLFHLAFLAVPLVIQEPEAWLRLDPVGRVQTLARVSFYVLALVLLNREPARSVLRGDGGQG